MSKRSLKTYRGKRDFRRTPKPAGGRRKRSPSRMFVVQKHDATALHYDFRLEAGGVLKSWAIPKGRSTDPGEERLAMATEAHPLEYGDFEGVIPEGEYGGCPVLVSDTGTYRNLTQEEGRELSAEEAVRRGHVKVWLEGKKLRGGFALTRMGQSRRWLLVKMKDEKADPKHDPVRDKPKSVLSGGTIEGVARRG